MGTRLLWASSPPETQSAEVRWCVLITDDIEWYKELPGRHSRRLFADSFCKAPGEASPKKTHWTERKRGELSVEPHMTSSFINIT
ncbi:hypothetical protein CDAR_109001 [Caerostris darwini]|uniref:Uncharacterized protein n=1 Tax=Caerostris darwini TaxID=1538125 RepID=A0AAV4QSC1_9ARAC|nr:hypothetical protein CDAR_109001 [Caerostris darwini]